MPRAGPLGARFRFLLVVVALVVVTATPADATLYPPSIRLALLFDRDPWSGAAVAPLPVPPGLIITRWER